MSLEKGGFPYLRFSPNKPPAMTPDEVEAYLDSHPGWMILTTVGRDGFPHSVPLGYFRVGPDLCLGCFDGTQKTVNVRRDERVSLLVESGTRSADLTGVLIQGRARVVTDEAERLALSQAAARARGVAEADLPRQARPGGAFIRVRRERTISWDYGRVRH